MENKEIRAVFVQFLDGTLNYIILSGQVEKSDFLKVRLRPVLVGGQQKFQAEEQRGKQAFHINMEASEAADYLTGLMGDTFKQAQLESAGNSASVLVSKKGKATIRIKKKPVPEDRSGALKAAWQNTVSHNRKKQYILEEGVPVPFLADLGVQTKEGQIIHARYDKFRQINRFLEFIEDVLP